MVTELLLNERRTIAEDAFVEMVVWRIPAPVSKCHHHFKYRLALVVNGRCVLRYDNESGKGDHKHLDEVEVPYDFTTARTLLDDFWRDVERWRS